MSDKNEVHKDENNKQEDYVLRLEEELHELESREESSTRRMQLLVYPSMVAFIILAAYGFYLVNSLTKDVHRMADSVKMMSDSVQKNMDIISDNTTAMSNKMTFLVSNTHDMNENMTDLVGTTGKMSNSVDNLSIYTGNMQQDMWSLNRSISKPFSMFKFMPFGGNSGSSQYRPPVYQQRQQQNYQPMMQPLLVPQQNPVSTNTNIRMPTSPIEPVTSNDTY